MTQQDGDSPRRSFRRAVIVLALAAFVLIVGWANLISALRGATMPGNPAVVGATVRSDFVITDVTPGSPAATAGIRAGDKVDIRSVAFDQRLPLLGYASFRRDDIVRFNVVRDGVAVPITVRAIWYQPALFNTILLKRAANTIFILVGAALLLMRPSRMLWGFYLYALGNVNATPYFFSFLPTWPYLGIYEVLTAGYYTAFVLAGLWIFVARFPGDTASGWRRWLDWGALPIGIFFACVQTASDAAYLLGVPYSPSIAYGWPALYDATLAVGIGCLATGFAHLHADQRQRFKWVFAAFVVYAATAAYAFLTTYLPGGGWPAAWTNAGFDAIDALAVVQVIIPISVAYAVLKHRVLDVNFVLSRALVYGIITTLVVGVFAIIDWIIGRALEHEQLAIAAELVAAVSFGFALNGIHKNVDSFVDRVLFRQRHFAELQLEHVANGLPHANSSASVDRMLVAEPVHAFGLTSAAVFRRSDSADVFSRQAEVGWGAGGAAELLNDDPLLIHLQGARGVLRLRASRHMDGELPPGPNAPTLAIPLFIRHQLDGIVLYGAHRTGEDIDPDEVRSLERLAVSAAAAYDHIEAEQMRQRTRALERDLGELQTEVVTLRAALARAR